MTSAMDALRKDLGSHLDTVGWGLFLLLSGLVLLVPTLPDGTWLTGVGTIVVGLGAVRASLGLPVSSFWTIIGVGLVVAGIGTIAGLALPWFALLLVVCGAAILIEEFVRWPRVA